MIDKYLNQYVTVLVPVRDDFGQTIAETGTVYRARVEATKKTVRNREGEFVQASWFIVLPPDVSLDSSAFIMLGALNVGGTGGPPVGDRFPIVSFEEIRGFARSHWEVYV